MRSTRSLLIVTLLVAASLFPLAGASWMHRGTQEPDTTYDANDGMMYLDPDTSSDAGSRKVYFNGQRIVAFTSYNPNVAALGSRHQTPGETSYTAMLGFWKDCNKDGYVGSSEYGLQEYRAELLPDDSVCAASTPATCPPTPQGGCPSGYIYPHNDGTWVRELIYIGSRANTGNGGPISANPTYFAAPGTQMWGHFGVPGDAPATVCSITAGWSTRSTGYVMKWADCHLGYRGTSTLNDVGGPAGGWDQEDIENSDSELNVENPLHFVVYGPNGDGHPDASGNGGLLGRDHEGQDDARRAFSVWDCSGSGATIDDPTGGSLSGAIRVKEPANMPGDPTNPGNPIVPPPTRTEDGYYNTGVRVFGDDGTRTAPVPSISVGDVAGGSYYEPANETYNVATTGECDPHGHEIPYPIAEGTNSNTNAIKGREEADLNFIFSAGARRNDQSALLGRNWPADLGTAPNRDLDTVGSSWRDNRAWLTLPQVVNRQTLEASQALYVTFYVALGPQVAASGISTPTGGATFIFGAEACGTNIGPGMPNQNGWVCDTSAWEARCLEDGSSADPCAIVGQEYHMRDIDCEDGAVSNKADRVGDVRVGASGVLASQVGCLGPADPRP